MGNIEREGAIVVRAAPIEVELGTALGWAIAFGLCTISVYLLRGLFSFTESTVGGLVGWIPGVGKWVNSKLEHAEQKFTHWVGQAAAGSELRMADAFHATADQVSSLGHEIFGMAVGFWQLTQWTSHVAWIALRGHELNKNLAAQLAANERRTKYLTRQQALQGKAIAHADSPPIGAGVQTRTKPVRSSVGHIGALDLPGIRARNRVRDETVPQSIEGLRARVAEAEGAIDNLWSKVRHLDKVTVGALAGALVATMLGRLGAGWIRCSNWSRIGRAGCRMPFHLLEDFLALIADFAVLTSICRVIPWLETAFEDIAAPMIDTLAKAGAALHCGGGLGDEILGVPALHLPAAPDGTLHLT